MGNLPVLLYNLLFPWEKSYMGRSDNLEAEGFLAWEGGSRSRDGKEKSLQTRNLQAFDCRTSQFF
jgi:hypothetical protein